MKPPTLSRPLWRRLRRVRSSRDGSLDLRPCRVLLRDGRWLDRVYLVEEVPYLRQWKIHPKKDPSRRDLPLDSIVDVDDSPTRLPARFATRLYRAGESWQRFTVFTLVLENGRRLPYLMGHFLDFPQWPDDVTPELVTGVIPHEAPDEFRSRTPSPHQAAAPHRWCLYRRPPKRWPRVVSALWTLLTWSSAFFLVAAAWVLQPGLGLLIPHAAIVSMLERASGPFSAGLPMASLLVLQAGPVTAPLVRRKRGPFRLAVLLAMVPALLLSPHWWELSKSVNGHAWRDRLIVALILWGIPAINAVLLLLPDHRKMRQGSTTPQEPAPPEAPAGTKDGKEGSC
ncbi:MAG: hypothetical protein O7F16_11700 [Acidobacteria bacterium]|nr:hypothetical protein [Acidobacteriota bacterium]